MKTSFYQHTGKRILDVAAAACGVVFLLPLLAFVAAAVRLSSAGPIFFRQLRVGKLGKPFLILKFRTMRARSEADSQLTASGDPRITRIGAWLRRTKIDELPQLINVLRGEMSLVGPRPEVPEFVS